VTGLYDLWGFGHVLIANGQIALRGRDVLVAEFSSLVLDVGAVLDGQDRFGVAQLVGRQPLL